MAIRSLARSSIRQAGRVNSALAGYESNYFHHLETVRLGGNAASVTFSNLSRYNDYQHFQLRIVARGSASELQRRLRLRFNGDTANNYSGHALNAYSDGNLAVRSEAGTSINYSYVGNASANTNTGGVWGAAIVDILDPFDTTKNTTVRALTGFIGGTSAFQQYIGIESGSWGNTAAISSMDISAVTADLMANSRFSLYGLKARA